MSGREDASDKRRRRTLDNAAAAGAQSEVVNRYGSAVKEHFVAYTGDDRETGQVLKKGLKSLADSRLSNTNFKTNVNQQAGFAAETKTVARENAEKVIAGDKNRTVRTDDLVKQTTSEGTTVGGTNDQLYDLVSVGKDGSYIEGSARQLKYVGGDPKDCCEKLLSKDYDKYREAGAEIEVPKDYYDGVKEELDRRAANLEKQVDAAQKRGDTALAEKHQQQLDRVNETKEHLKQGALTKSEAIEARLHPKLSTAADVAKLSHRAGLESAKTGALIGAGMSGIRHMVAVIKGDEDPEEAALAVAGDTVQTAGVSYATGFFGSAMKGWMQNADSTMLQQLSKSSLPAMVATAVLETGKTLQRCAQGEIDGVECLTELGEKGSGIVASTAGATIGQLLIPLPVVGGLIGSMCGYALSSMFYHSLTEALNHEKKMHQEWLQIKAECEEAIRAMREYRFEVEIAVRNYFTHYVGEFENAFATMQKAYDTGDLDFMVEGANHITEVLGGEVLFRTTDELDRLMASSAPIVL